MWAGDFSGNGRTEHIYATYNDDRGPFPVALRQELVQQLPYLKSRYPTFADYAGTSVREMFGADQLGQARRYEARQLASIIAWNEGGGRFLTERRPFPAQLAPMYEILPVDLYGKGRRDIVMGGNLDAVKPQAGPYDASFGVILRGDTTGSLRGISSRKSGFSVRGQIRGLKILSSPVGRLIVVARSNDRIQVYRMNPQ